MIDFASRCDRRNTTQAAFYYSDLHQGQSRYQEPNMLLVPLLLLPLAALAQDGGPSGSNRIDSGQCPSKSRHDNDELLVFSPFRPWWTFASPSYTPPNCWVMSDCLFEAAGESRKQQFAAVALVMGLIPPTLRDIAWPARRLVYVTKELPYWAETLVLSLGLVTVKTGSRSITRERSCQSGPVAKMGWRMRSNMVRCCIALCTAALVLCLAGLAAMEVFSKRSSLGCPAPVFIVVWHLIALVPGIIHRSFAFLRHKDQEKQQVFRLEEIRTSAPPSNSRVREVSNASSLPLQIRSTHTMRDDQGGESEHGEATAKEQEKKMTSAIQGANEAWPVQMAWSIYYIAGTLVFSSIMAVTAPELVIWVILGLSTAACSKILAFFLCLVFEDTRA
jgi:hypothetical protein